MKKLLLLSLTLTSSIALASELNVPNQFEDGQVTSAAQMNANFDAIQAAVNDNHARIESMQQPTKAVFQGFSTESMNGGQGLIAMQQACHNFLPGSHICNTTEFAESPYNADAAATMVDNNAWVLVNITANEQRIYETNGNLTQDTSRTLSCRGWRSSTYQSSDWDKGSSVSISGGIIAISCSALNKIACCK
jgi:hypothetical protein